MAQKRMFSKRITDSGEFQNMPLSAQALYFHLNLHADDDGIIDNIRQIARAIGANEDDIKILLGKSFILLIEGEIVVVRDWWIHNTLLKDRYEESLYKDKLDTIYSVDTKKKYTTNDNKMLTECYPRLRIDKNRIDKNRVDKNNITVGAKAPFTPPTLEEVQAYIQEKGYKVDAVKWWNYYDAKGWMIGKNKMVKWKSAVATWNTRNYDEERQAKIAAQKAYAKDVEMRANQKTTQQRNAENLRQMESEMNKLVEEHYECIGDNQTMQSNQGYITELPGA